MNAKQGSRPKSRRGRWLGWLRSNPADDLEEAADASPLSGTGLGESENQWQRREFFASAADHTSLVAVDTPEGFFIVSTDDVNVGKSLFVSRARGEFNVLRHGMSILAHHGLALRAREGPFIDVGANIGTSIIAALVAHGFARGIAIEPEPGNHRLLKVNVTANGLGKRVRMMQVAASDRPGGGSLLVSSSKSGAHELRNFEGKKAKGERKGAIRVKKVTLDQLVDRSLVEADGTGLIWIDAQGEEGQILAGAGKLLEHGVPVILEIAPRHLERHNGAATLSAVAAECYSGLVDLRSVRGTPKRPEKLSFDLQGAGELANLIDRYRERSEITDVLLLRT